MASKTTFITDNISTRRAQHRRCRSLTFASTITPDCERHEFRNTAGIFFVPIRESMLKSFVSFLFPPQPLPLRGPWQDTGKIQTVHQLEILSSCGYSTCKDFQCTLFGFVLEKNHKLLRSAKNLLDKRFFLSFCLFVFYRKKAIW